MRKLYACLRVKDFAVAVVLRGQRSRPAVVFSGTAPNVYVYEANAAARAAGIRAGMTLSQAQGRAQNLLAEPRNEQVEQQAQRELLEAAQLVSPRVEDREPGLLRRRFGGRARCSFGCRETRSLRSAAWFIRECGDFPESLRGDGGDAIGRRRYAHLPGRGERVFAAVAYVCVAADCRGAQDSQALGHPHGRRVYAALGGFADGALWRTRGAAGETCARRR